MGNNTIEIKKRKIEEIVDHLITQVALQKIDIDRLNRAIGLQGYFSENPPISIQEHHSILFDLKTKMLNDFKEFYGANKQNIIGNTWLNKIFEEFFVKMEDKYFK